jgi:hypothetical protein
MVTLETTIQLMTFHYQLDPQNQEILDQLKNLYFISQNSIWNHCGAVAKSIQKKLKEFLKFHEIPFLASQQRADDQVFKRHTDSIIPNHDVVALVQPPEIFLKDKTDRINREEAEAIGVPMPMPSTSSNGAGDVSFLFLEDNPTSPSVSSSTLPSSSPFSDYSQTIDSSFLKEFDDIFKQAIDVNVSP